MTSAPSEATLAAVKNVITSKELAEVCVKLQKRAARVIKFYTNAIKGGNYFKMLNIKTMLVYY
jgi:hypothetical protein